MVAISWDVSEEIRYEAGLDRGVLFPKGGVGVAWNGLISVDEREENTKTTEFYYNGVKRYVDVLPGEFAGTISAITYPDEFLQYDGYLEMDEVSGIFMENQGRRVFDLSYRTLIGNVENGTDYGYKIHLLYNLVAKPSSNSRQTISDIVDPNVFSWSVKGTPVVVEGRYPTAHFILDSTKMYSTAMQAVEDILYGTQSTAPRMITPEEIAALTTITIVDNGDGTWTASGPDEYIYPGDPGEFILDVMGITFLDEDTYTITST